jgi:cardiolipin synthase A/B
VIAPQVWRQGNRVRLLENGEEFFPRVFAAIDAARKEVFIETFILFDDPVGRELREKLIAAAGRGVRVELTVDGYGSPDLSPEFITGLTSAGAHLHVFDPRPRLLGMRMNIFRRLHRKIVVVDHRRAWIGGLNFSYDHLREFGEQAKQDYAVEVEGPLVADVRALAASAVAPAAHWWQRRSLETPPAAPPRVGDTSAMLVTRDNEARRDEIENHYRAAIRKARREIIVATAYFFPGYRLLRELHAAARRGVRVSLILQGGRADMPIVRWVATTLYDYLLLAGARIYEYCDRPLHAKVAVIDEQWSTVGSSNLDPLSLSLNLEANVMVDDRDFGRRLAARLRGLIEDSCEEIDPKQARKRTLWRQALSFLAFHAARRLPAWAGWLPGHHGPVRPLPIRSAAALDKMALKKEPASKEKDKKPAPKRQAA